MPCCAAPGCTSSQFKGCGLTFHLFPRRNIEKQKQWILNMGRDDWIPNAKSCLCSKHFSPECFDRTGQTVRLRDSALPTLFDLPRKEAGDANEELKMEPKKRKKVITKVKEELQEVMASRPKRVIKAKRKDDEIYYTSEPKPKRHATGKSTKRKAKVQSSELPHNKKQKKRVVDPRLTDENAAIYKRIQESIKVEKENEGLDYPEKGDDLPRKRIPKPSFKLRFKEEQISDEDETFSGEDTDESDHIPAKSPKKDRKYSKSSVDLIGIRASQKSSSSLKNEKDSNGIATQEENADEMTICADKTQPLGKDKIIHLPDNRTYFEFAEPKKKVILQIKPVAELHELKTQTVQDVIFYLELRKLINNEAKGLLESFRELPDGLLMFNARVQKKLAKLQSDEVRKFVTVLYFYSYKAFDLLSTVFCFPDKSLVRERLQTKNFWPGFTIESMEMLKSMYPKDPTETVCIMFDNVTIKKECRLDHLNDRWIGHVDLCGGPTPSDSDGIPLASEILLFTVVGIGRDWKLPFGYFLNNGLSGEELQNIVTEAITILEDCGLRVRVIVCDGFPSAVKMALLFGCNIHTKSFAEVVTSFPHPVHCDSRIHLVFGIYHALDLMRNLLAEKSLLRSSTYGIINYKYFELLRGRRNKSSEARVLEDPEHMKFYHLQKILRQCHPSFSCMENRAFELADELALKDFEGSTAAANFVADVYRAFDLLNSRNPVTTGEKPPITNPFLAEQLESMTVIGQRIFGLEFLSGKKVISSGRWMSVMLFAFTLKSVSILASELLNGEELMYFTTYRLNLDHSDMMLSCIQRCGGWDGVPTAAEFREGYKGLLESLSESFKISAASNDFDGHDLTVGQGVICPFKRGLHIRRCNDIDFVPRSYHLIDYSTEITVRARFIIKHISQRLTCTECMALMLDDDHSSDIEKKKVCLDYIEPSKFVTNIMKISESVMRAKLLESQHQKVEHIVVHILNEYFIHKNNFVYSDHEIEEPHHIISLIKVIIRTFVYYKLYPTKYLSEVKSWLLKYSW